MARLIFVLAVLLGLFACQVASQSISVTPSLAVGLPAPTNVVNRCVGHIINICPSWANPAGVVYASFIVTYTDLTTSAVVSFSTTTLSGRVTNLAPSTGYSFVVTGVTAGGVQGTPSAPVTFTTDPTDPKLDPLKDIHNIVCDSVNDTTTGRLVIQCSWLPATETLTRLVIKWRCVSPIRENNRNKKRLFGAAAQATAVTLNVNRDVATCTVYFHAYYIRRPSNRVQLTVLMGF
jgi:hypothetical protein